MILFDPYIETTYKQQKGLRMPRAKRTNPSATKATQNYRHPEPDSPMRPDVGTQAQFRKKKPPSDTR
jgi:hypothetical protein